MQAEALPITITADQGFSSALRPLLHKLEMWINFQALKADWYGDENHVLTFNYMFVKTLEDKKQEMKVDNWVVEKGFAYHYQSSSLTTNAFIEISDLVKNKTGIEQAIKSRLTRVANAVAKKHGLVALV
ncbi:hypothetical protein [Psychromonas algicola]|uniref:hypothetical protein n=1 Tax=Psychromonas algicola TaxID=2555642 RepID=UPI001068168D|nr:hypothetical protein [Psychromonas sp. RZ5]TEW49867.1 hypothetical protein E2R67_10380 [Psychromonas sp. RZ5]